MSEAKTEPSVRGDLMALTKARLSAMVLVTTFVGYWLCSRTQGFDWALMLHTLFGTALAALGSSVFNQLMEVEADRKMGRTSDRPLPARRMSPTAAFLVGMLLCGFGVVHLGVKVNTEASALAALTLLTYIFIYTPMKQKSGANTLVGAVSGALPPLIGWAAGYGPNLAEEGFRWYTIWSAPALFLFTLLFFWQLPHFVAINWMYRDQYERGGFVMWSNGDESGDKTSKLALLFSVPLIPMMAIPVVSGHLALWAAILGALCGCAMIWYALKFRKARTRESARSLFFFTLLYLPLLLGIVMLGWRGGDA